MSISKSAAFRVARSFEMNEMIPLTLALIVAVVTGMSTLYANSPTFGSLGDYLGLLVWGAAVDQGKNALQQQTGQTTTAPATANAGAPTP